jgi:hypothetical protein
VINIQGNQSIHSGIQDMQDFQGTTDPNQTMLTNLNECGIEEIDEMIRRNAESRKQYSKTYVEKLYTPLTRTEKIKFLEELSVSSDKRMHLYSELFKEIKTQISFISNNLSTTLVENNNDKSLGRLRMNQGNKFNTSSMNNIDEENDILDMSIDIDSQSQSQSQSQFDEKRNRNHKLSSNNKTSKNTPKAKNIIKIDNPNISLNNVTNISNSVFSKKASKYLFNGECDIDDGDENIGVINVPQNEYKSNFLKDVDDFSIKRVYSTSVTGRKNSSRSVNFAVNKSSNAYESNGNVNGNGNKR